MGPCSQYYGNRNDILSVLGVGGYVSLYLHFSIGCISLHTSLSVSLLHRLAIPYTNLYSLPLKITLPSENPHSCITDLHLITAPPGPLARTMEVNADTGGKGATRASLHTQPPLSGQEALLKKVKDTGEAVSQGVNTHQGKEL